MTVSMKSLGIDKLPLEERLALVGDIWDSIAAEGANLPLSPEHREELERRLAAHRANPEQAIPWEDVRKSLGMLLGR